MRSNKPFLRKTMCPRDNVATDKGILRYIKDCRLKECVAHMIIIITVLKDMCVIFRLKHTSTSRRDRENKK